MILRLWDKTPARRRGRVSLGSGCPGWPAAKVRRVKVEEEINFFISEFLFVFCFFFLF